VANKKLLDTRIPRGRATRLAWWYGDLRKSYYVTIEPDPGKGSLGHLRNPPRFIPESVAAAVPATPAAKP
jgi:hypothetical protein